jgi:hypothetical protein
MSAKNNSMYSLVEDTIHGMKIGQKKSIPIPDNTSYFRKYLCEISKHRGLKFTTKIVDSKMEIMRVRYFNINSSEVQ